MEWIYLSPHLDDAAFSCGGLIWEQGQAGKRVAVWTICAGDPPEGALSNYAQSLHRRWGIPREAVARRRAEDLDACQRLGAAARHFSIPDCIYRRSPFDGRPLYNSDEDIFGRLHPHETGLMDVLTRELRETLPAQASLVCPLTLGGHVDHQLARAAAQRLEYPLWYYADFPYVLQDSPALEKATAGLHPEDFPLSPAGLRAWGDAVAAYASQISTFWSDLESMRASLQDYYRQFGGLRLWRSPENRKNVL